MRLRFLSPLLVLACSCSLFGSGDSLTSSTESACIQGYKRCGDTCQSMQLPMFGCGAISCEPCAVPANGTAICAASACASGPCLPAFADCDHQPSNGCEADLQADKNHCGSCTVGCDSSHGSSHCVAGACVITSCADGYQDCNADAADSCESASASDPLHCGDCATACMGTEVCFKGKCAVNADVLGWLDTHRGGWCLDDYNKLINLCGKISVCHWTLCGDLDQDPAGSPSCYDDYQHEHDVAVPFCCDTRFLKPYPNGLSVAVGFYYDGVSTGNAAQLGGDGGKAVSLVFDKPGELQASADDAPFIYATLTTGYYLVEYQITPAKAALFVNGILAATGTGPPQPIELATDQGPGMVLGSRMSYWWQEPKTLRYGPFFFHLREVATPGTWSFTAATETGPSTLLRFDDSGISGNAWTAATGAQTAYGANRTPSGVQPSWVSDLEKQCFAK